MQEKTAVSNNVARKRFNQKDMSFSVVVSNSDYQVPGIIAVPFYDSPEIVTEKPTSSKAPVISTDPPIIQQSSKPIQQTSESSSATELERIVETEVATDGPKASSDVTTTLEIKEEEVIADKSQGAEDTDELIVLEPDFVSPISTKKVEKSSTKLITSTTTTTTTTTTTPKPTITTTQTPAPTTTTTQKKTSATSKITKERRILSTEKLTTQVETERNEMLEADPDAAGMNMTVVGGVIGLVVILGAIVVSFHFKRRSKLQKDSRASLNASLQSGKAESSSSNATNGYLQMNTEDPDLKIIRDDSLDPIDATEPHETQNFIPKVSRVSEYKFDSS